MSILQITGFGALALLVAGWLVVSFARPGLGRVLVEWLAATCIYVALFSLFLHLFLGAHESGSVVGQVGFGFLCFLFGSGGIVSLASAILALRDPGTSHASATN